MSEQKSKKSSKPLAEAMAELSSPGAIGAEELRDVHSSLMEAASFEEREDGTLGMSLRRHVPASDDGALIMKGGYSLARDDGRQGFDMFVEGEGGGVRCPWRGRFLVDISSAYGKVYLVEKDMPLLDVAMTIYAAEIAGIEPPEEPRRRVVGISAREYEGEEFTFLEVEDDPEERLPRQMTASPTKTIAPSSSVTSKVMSAKIEETAIAWEAAVYMATIKKGEENVEIKTPIKLRAYDNDAGVRIGVTLTDFERNVYDAVSSIYDTMMDEVLARRSEGDFYATAVMTDRTIAQVLTGREDPSVQQTEKVHEAMEKLTCVLCDIDMTSELEVPSWKKRIPNQLYGSQMVAKFRSNLVGASYEPIELQNGEEGMGYVFDIDSMKALPLLMHDMAIGQVVTTERALTDPALTEKNITIQTTNLQGYLRRRIGRMEKGSRPNLRTIRADTIKEKFAGKYQNSNTQKSANRRTANLTDYMLAKFKETGFIDGYKTNRDKHGAVVSWLICPAEKGKKRGE